jgi:hypothetical protein
MSSKGHSWCLCVCMCARECLYVWVPSSLLSLLSLFLFSISLAVSLSLSLSLSLTHPHFRSLTLSLWVSLLSPARSLFLSLLSLFCLSLSLSLSRARFCLTWVLLQGLQKPSRVAPRIFEVKNPTADNRTYLPHPWYWPFLNSPRYSSPNCSMCTPCPSRSPCVYVGVAVSGWNG